MSFSNKLRILLQKTNIVLRTLQTRLRTSLCKLPNTKKVNTIFEQINVDLRNAMYTKEKCLLITIRGIKKELVELAKKAENNGKVTDEKAILTLRSMIKQRTMSAQIYKEQNRNDLEEIELKEIEIIKRYLPIEISDEELRAEIIKLIGTTKSVEGPGQTGILLKETIQKLDKKASRERISKMAKDLLNAYALQKRG